MSRPFRCVAANVTEYIKTLAQAQELNVDEAEVACKNQDDVCYGKIEERAKRLENYIQATLAAVQICWVDLVSEVPWQAGRRCSSLLPKRMVNQSKSEPTQPRCVHTIGHPVSMSEKGEGQ